MAEEGAAMRRWLAIAVGAALSACASTPPAATVIATREAPAIAGQRASDPAIWAGWGRVSGLVGDGFVVTPSTAGGLLFHDGDGAVASRVPGLALSFVDVAMMSRADSYAVVVGATEREGRRTRLSLSRIDPQTPNEPRPWGVVETDLAPAKAFCMRQVGHVLHALAIDQAGRSRHLKIEEGAGGEPVAREVSRPTFDGALPGCGINPSSATAYVMTGSGQLWRYDLATSASVAIPLRGPAGRAGSGVAFVDRLAERYLVTIDPGARTLSIWGLSRDEAVWRGSVRILDAEGRRPVSGIAGVDVVGATAGPYGGGLLVVSGSPNRAGRTQRYVSWPEVLRTLEP